jgi:tRNA uridine 5-carboxymethylaminomethyl modification enzyme
MRSKIAAPNSQSGETPLQLSDCHPERSKAQPSAVEGPCVSDGRSTPVDFSAALGQPLSQLLRRPDVSIEQLAPALRDLVPDFFASSLPTVVNLSSQQRNELKSVETEIKYAGYLTQQQRSIDRLKKAEQRSIPDWFDYRAVSGLSREMQEKLLKIRPRTLGHAARIPGVTPAAVSLVNVYIELQARRRERAASL